MKTIWQWCHHIWSLGQFKRPFEPVRYGVIYSWIKVNDLFVGCGRRLNGHCWIMNVRCVHRCYGGYYANHSYNHRDVMWAPSRLKSSTICICLEHSNTLHYWPFMSVFPVTGPVMRKAFQCRDVIKEIYLHVHWNMKVVTSLRYVSVGGHNVKNTVLAA